jgi:hypothetical protein
LPAAGNSTGNEEKGETPLASVADVNATTTINAAAVGNDTADDESVADLADDFQKILRSKQDGLSPEFKNQSPQEKYLRALSSLSKHSLTGMNDKGMAKAMHQMSRTPESWLQPYLQSMELDSTLASPHLVRELEDFSDCQDTRKYLGENMQLITFGEKVVAVTSPSFLKERATPSAMMRKCAENLIQARSLIDHGTDAREHDLKSEDRYNILANYFAMANPIGEGTHLSGSSIDSRVPTKKLECVDTDEGMERTPPPIVTCPFSLKEKLLALDDARAKGLNRLRSEFTSHENELLKMVHDDFDDEDAKSKKIHAVHEHAAGLANKAAKLLKTSHANKRQRLIQSVRVDELQCEMSRMVAEHEVVRQEVGTLQRAKQSTVGSEVAQVKKQFKAEMDQFEAKTAEHRKEGKG